jgi:hypothetical protein
MEKSLTLKLVIIDTSVSCLICDYKGRRLEIGAACVCVGGGGNGFGNKVLQNVSLLLYLLADSGKWHTGSCSPVEAS